MSNPSPRLTQSKTERDLEMRDRFVALLRHAIQWVPLEQKEKIRLGNEIDGIEFETQQMRLYSE